MFKRVFSFLISAVLFVGCFVLDGMNNDVIAAGAGNGENERIESAEQLEALLAFISEKDSANGFASYSLLSDGAGNGTVSDSDYKSATVHITTDLTSESSSDNTEYSSGVYSTSQSVSRSLSIYITETATYYVSKGYYSLVTDTVDGKKERIINFDVEISVTDGGVYLMLHEFIYTYGGENGRLRSTMSDKWIEADGEIAEMFITIDTENREVLGAMEEMVAFLDEKDAINESGVTELDADDLRDMADEGDDAPQLDDDQELSLILDMSDPANPYVSSVSFIDSVKVHTFTTGYNDYFQPITEDVTIKNKVSAVQEIRICNVNNTVINMDLSKVTESVKGEDSKDVLFIIKEMKEGE